MRLLRSRSDIQRRQEGRHSRGREGGAFSLSLGLLRIKRKEKKRQMVPGERRPSLKETDLIRPQGDRDYQRQRQTETDRKETREGNRGERRGRYVPIAKRAAAARTSKQQIICLSPCSLSACLLFLSVSLSLSVSVYLSLSRGLHSLPLCLSRFRLLTASYGALNNENFRGPPCRRGPPAAAAWLGGPPCCCSKGRNCWG